MAFEFPQGFLWGSATAAHQVEGNNINSDAWLMENLPESVYAEPSADACDHYHRYGEDIAMLAGLGFNAYRFSIEWARVQPEEGWFSRAEIEHYRRMLAACHENGLNPVITFHHFTSPRWLLSEGGWENEKTPDRFARYCERITRDLGDLIGAGCTLNEPNLSALFKYFDMFKPRLELATTPMWRMAASRVGIEPGRFVPFLYATGENGFDIIRSAHRKAIKAIKGAGGNFPVGWTLALQDIQPADDSEATAKNTAQLHQEINTLYLETVREGHASGLDDFVGVQAYSRTLAGPNGFVNPPEAAEKTQMGYEFYPEALEATIRMAVKEAGVPVYVTENGLATADDTRRVEYVQRALNGVASCLRDGLPVKGYFYWSMLDNFEWNVGYKMTFGMVAVDRETQRRTVKPSARFLGEIARKNGV
jgi:beta-glucosidase